MAEDIGAGVHILVDGDACPVKEEIYRVARRYGVPVRVVSNSHFRVPVEPLIARVIVGSGFDAADDWIAEQSCARSIVVTTDILLADRCVKAGATVLAPTGRIFDAASIGNAVATRALMADLRAMDQISGGPPPFSKADRSRFLSALDQALVMLRRTAGLSATSAGRITSFSSCPCAWPSPSSCRRCRSCTCR